MKYCAGHMQELGAAIRRHGFWRYVDSNPAHIRGFTARWLLGKATKEEIDPLVVLMLEIGSKAVRLGLRQNSQRCPLCAIAFITKDTAEPTRQVQAYMEQVIRPLMLTNGNKAGGQTRGRAAAAS